MSICSFQASGAASFKARSPFSSMSIQANPMKTQFARNFTFSKNLLPSSRPGIFLMSKNIPKPCAPQSSISFSSYSTASAYMGHCTLQLYTLKGCGKNCERTEAREISISRETAKKADEIVCDHFNIHDELDKRLICSIFSSDKQFDWHELVRSSNFATIGMQIVGDRSVIFDAFEKMNADFVQNSPNDIRIRVSSILGKKVFRLTNDEIRERKASDTVLVAFANSRGFAKMIQCSTNMLMARTLEKISRA